MRYVIIFSLFVILIVILGLHNVSKEVTNNDRIYIELLLDEIGERYDNKIHDSFNEELSYILTIQEKIRALKIASRGIAIGTKREPENFYKQRIGQCYDLSRTLEKIFAFSGFTVRHTFVLKKQGDFPLWNFLFKKGVPSHALLEVNTLNGWVIVDPSSSWVSVTRDNNSINIHKVKDAQYKKYNWFRGRPHGVFDNDVFVIYGFYSRHGKFFPPYNFVPDINYLDFLFYNISMIFDFS